MGKYSKWIGAGLGIAFGGGILGGILGFALGSMLGDTTMADEKRQTRGAGGGHFNEEFRRKYANQRYRTGPQDFAASLMVLSAAVMKADGKLLKSELDFIKKFFSRQFGPEIAGEQILILQRLLKQDIPVREVCGQIKYLMQHPERLQLLHYLFGIAQADGHVHSSEDEMIRRIAGYLGISQKDYESIQAMFFKSPDSSYKILEISSDATDAEVKRAYRKMAVKFHPDKVSNLGEAAQKAAEEKFVKVQEAYERVKKERGMK